MSIDTLYKNAILSAAAYADWSDKDSVLRILAEKGLTAEQIDTLFLGVNSIFADVKFEQYNYGGFSATLFFDRETGKYTIAFRGTEPGFWDLSNDLLLALGIQSFADFLNFGQNESIERFMKDAGLIDAEGNLLVPANSINFTGHSLGGHLATMAAYKFPELVDQVYTYNGAGISSFDALFVNLLENNVIDSGFNPGTDVTNVFADKGPEVTANTITFWRPGQYQSIFIEQGAAMDNHGIDKLVQSLSLYRLLARISPTLDSQLGLKEIYSILDCASNIAENSLEFITQALWLQTLQTDESLKEDVELFYQQVDNNSIQHQIVSITHLRPEDLAVFACTNVDTGRGFRYALIELLPFAMTSNLVTTRANISAYDITSTSEQYLYDRASLLTAISARNASDADNTMSVDVAWVDSAWFYDFATDQAVCANGAELGPEDRRVIFGGETADLVLGAAANDALYGGDCNDTLEGKAGSDYLEGGDGNDLIEGNEDNDILVGSAGNDQLDGGSGSDLFAGGADDDVYVFTATADAGVVFDQVNDEGITDDVMVDQASLRSVAWRAIAHRVWQNPEGTLLLTLESQSGTEDLVVTAKRDGQVQRILLRNFSAGDYGITLPDYSDGQPKPIDDESIHEWYTGDATNNTIVGTSGRNGIDGAAGDDRLFGGGGNDFISGDEKHVATADWSYTAWKTVDAAGWNWLGVTDISGQQLPSGHDLLDGGDGDDLLRGDRGNDVVMGGDGNDIVSGGSGHDLLYGGAGDDWIRGDDLFIYGVDVRHEHGSDYASGGTGKDDIETHGGDDILDGGAGADYLKGGEGDDLYLFNPDDSPIENGLADIVSDDSGSDTIRFGEGIDPEHIHLQQQGQDLVVLLQDNQAILIRNGFSGSIEQFQFSDGFTLDFQDLMHRYFADNLILNLADMSTVYGGNNDDFISIDGDDTEVSAGQGDDIVYGNGSHHTYFYEKGDGVDRIMESGTRHRIRFGAAIHPEDVRLELTQDGILNIHVGNNGDKIIIHGYTNGLLPVGTLEFMDGTVIPVDELATAQDIRLIPELIPLPDDSLDEFAGVELQMEKWLAAAKSYVTHFYMDAGWKHIGDGWLEMYSVFSDGSTDRRQLYFDEWTIPLSDQSREYIDRGNYYGSREYDFYEYQTVSVTESLHESDLSNIAGGRSETEANRQLQQMAGLLNTPSAWNDAGVLNSLYGSAITQDELVRLLMQMSRHHNHGETFDSITPFTQVVNHTLAHDGTERLAIIKGDSQNQVIYTYGVGAVDAGGGDDVVDARSNSRYGIDAPGQFIFGDLGNDTIYGTYSRDRILGGSGNDRMYGEDGDDVIKGGAGHDFLMGGYGNDRLTGGKGSDIYRYDANDYHGHDLILNRMSAAGKANKDVLEISGLTDYRQLWFGREGNDLRVDVLGTTDRILVHDWFHDDPAQYVEGRDENELDAIVAITRSGLRYEITNEQSNTMDARFDQLLQAMANWEAGHPGEAASIHALDMSSYDSRWLAMAES